MTVAGTVRGVTLLAKLTLCPVDDAAELSEMVQDVDPAPVKVFLPHDNPLTVGARVVPAPFSAMERAGALLDVIVIWPRAAPPTTGLN